MWCVRTRCERQCGGGMVPMGSVAEPRAQGVDSIGEAVGQGPFMEFELGGVGGGEYKELIVLETSAVESATEACCKQHAIPAPSNLS